MEIVAAPHGRIMYVIVEADGCFLGQQFVPFGEFRGYLNDHAAELAPDYVMVCGTDSSRFGRIVETLDSVRAVFTVPSVMETRTRPDGTRRGPIEVGDAPWGLVWRTPRQEPSTSRTPDAP